jgi:hypothetical protein
MSNFQRMRSPGKSTETRPVCRWLHPYIKGVFKKKTPSEKFPSIHTHLGRTPKMRVPHSVTNAVDIGMFLSNHTGADPREFNSALL